MVADLDEAFGRSTGSELRFVLRDLLDFEESLAEEFVGCGVGRSHSVECFF